MRCRTIVHVLLVIMALGTPGAAMAQSTDELPIKVRIVPAPTETPGVPPQDGEAPGVPAGGGTVIALISRAHHAPAATPPTPAVLDLVVNDQRGYDSGWIVKVMQVGATDDEANLALDRYLRRTVSLDGLPMQDGDRPHGVRLSIGQPLDRLTPVLNAPHGTGLGAYWIRFAVADPAPHAPTLLVVSITAAP